MESKLAEKCREEMVEICKKMTPEEQLQAFVNHSQLLAEVYRAGEAARLNHRTAAEHSHPKP
jgi:hypothetical protein